MRRVRKRVEIFIRAAEYCSQSDDYIFNYRNVSTRLERKRETKLGNLSILFLNSQNNTLIGDSNSLDLT